MMGFLKKAKFVVVSASRNKQLVDSAGLQDFWTAWRPLLYIALVFIHPRYRILGVKLELAASHSPQ